MTIMSCYEEITVNYNYSPAVATPGTRRPNTHGVSYSHSNVSHIKSKIIKIFNKKQCFLLVLGISLSWW